MKKEHKEIKDNIKKLKETIKKEKKEIKKEKKKHWKIVLLILIPILIIAYLIIFKMPVSYTATEIYYENEPYTDKDCKYEKLVHNVQWGSGSSSVCEETECISTYSLCVDTNWVGNCMKYQEYCSSSQCISYDYTCEVTIKNLDTKGGTFSLDGYVFKEDNTDLLIEKVSYYLQPGDETDFRWSISMNPDDFKYCIYKNLNVPSKQECDNVIKYTTVTKERSVTKMTTNYKLWKNQVVWIYEV